MFRREAVSGWGRLCQFIDGGEACLQIPGVDDSHAKAAGGHGMVDRVLAIIKSNLQA